MVYPTTNFNLLRAFRQGRPRHAIEPRSGAGRGLPIQGWARRLLLAWLVFVPALCLAIQVQVDPPSDWWSAIRRDDATTVQEMLLRRVDPTAFNTQGNPALTQAARDQSWRVFDLLAVTPEVQIDQPNALDETPLMYLAILGQTARAEKLIQAGAQVNRLGWTPLHYAASKAQMDMARLLIGQGAIVNAPGPDGTTPLMMAALSGKRDMAELLLSQGADPTMFNAAGETAIDWAHKRNNTRMAAWLAGESEAFAAQRQAQARAQVPAGARSITEYQVPGTAQSDSIASELAGQGTPAQDESSFSRYFDLGRFEDTPAAMP